MSVVQDDECSSARALHADRALSKQMDAERRAAARRAAWVAHRATPHPAATTATTPTPAPHVPVTDAAVTPGAQSVPFDVDALRELAAAERDGRPLLVASVPDVDVPLELVQDAEAFIRGDVIGVASPLDLQSLRQSSRAKYREMNKAVRKVTPAGRRTEFTMLVYAGPDADVILIAHERAHKNSYHDNVYKYKNWFALMQATHDA